MNLGSLISKETLIEGSLWELSSSVNGFANKSGYDLVTQIASGRSFQIIDPNIDHLSNGNKFSRLKVRLLEDGYICWLDYSYIKGQSFSRDKWEPSFLSRIDIETRIPLVMRWVEKAASNVNKYLWGGSIGPDFDCSGLVQASFSSQGIWLPRDAYQQERFCESISILNGTMNNLLTGDLLFFGDQNKCTHVGIYSSNQFYWHSSGINNGNNGIKKDKLTPLSDSSIATYYFSKLRGAGRVMSCHDGSTLP